MNPKHPSSALVMLFALVGMFPLSAYSQQTATASTESDMGEIAKKLNNPTASLISVPFQSNFDFGGGPGDDGFQYKLNVQPVVPLHLNDDWKIIWRTILPFITQEDIIGQTDQTGLGDLNTTLWLTSARKEEGKPIIGFGPVLQLPTATDDLLGSEKWSVGPSVIFVQQMGGWTVGSLVNQLWSVAGDDDRDEVNITSMQPFVNYTTPQHTTFGINSEMNYNWDHEQWTIPLNFFITQLVKIGGRPVSFQIGGRYYAEAPDEAPEWGFRFAVTFVFPE